MLSNEFPINTINDLIGGTKVTDGKRTVIIGETDCVAFTDDNGEWQVATAVVWDSVEDTERFATLLKRAKLDEVIRRQFPNPLGVFYADDNEMAAVEDSQGNMHRVWADGDTQKYTP